MNLSDMVDQTRAMGHLPLPLAVRPELLREAWETERVSVIYMMIVGVIPTDASTDHPWELMKEAARKEGYRWTINSPRSDTCDFVRKALRCPSPEEFLRRCLGPR